MNDSVLPTSLSCPIRAVCFDVDGVLVRGNTALPGAKELLHALNQASIPFLCLSNNSSMTPAQYASKLTSLGFPIPQAAIITSSLATRRYLESHHPRGTRIFMLGMEGLHSALFGDGYFVSETQSPDVVVVGHDVGISYPKCVAAVTAVLRGKPFIGTNPDVTIPIENAELPEAGALLAYIVAATGKEPVIIGKPAAPMFEQALAHLRHNAGNVIMVGDRMDTDVLGASRVGMQTAFVETATTTHRTIDVQPTVVIDDLHRLKAWLWERI